MTNPTDVREICKISQQTRFSTLNFCRLGVAALLAASLVACGNPNAPFPTTDDDSDPPRVGVTSGVTTTGTTTGTTTTSTSGTGGDCNGGEGGNGHGQGGSGQGGSGQGGAIIGSSVVTGVSVSVGSMGTGGNTAPPPTTTLLPAAGVTIEKITLNQGVQHTLMANGQKVSDSVPVVASRAGVLRVMYTTDSSYDGKAVTATLSLGDQELEQTLVLGNASTENDLQSTINFELTAEQVRLGLSYRIEITQQTSTDDGAINKGAYFPHDTQQDVLVQKSGGLKIVIVPIRYDSDQSGRMPDTSAAQLELLRNEYLRLYPVSHVDISVREDAMRWNQTLRADGDGWNSLLLAIADLRAKDNVSDDTYYYGMFRPTETFGSFCSKGCVAGLGFVSPEMNTWSRASIGLGFEGQQLAEVAAHELGHNHGRTHTPCGNPANPDPDFPYSDGSIGRWGFDIVDGELQAPSSSKDFMSYCDPTWVSDFTYAALFERARFVNQVHASIQGSSEPRAYDRVVVQADGSMDWADEVSLRRMPTGEARVVDVTTERGSSSVEASFIRFDHVEGGVLFVPRDPAAPARSRARSIRMRIKGRMRTVQR